MTETLDPGMIRDMNKPLPTWVTILDMYRDEPPRTLGERRAYREAVRLARSYW